jgi:hypothetical protein
MLQLGRFSAVVNRHKTVNSFVAAIDVWAQKRVPNIAEREVLQVYMACFQGIITQSPVDNGTFRLSWFPAIGKPVDKVAEQQTSPQGASFAANRMEPLPPFKLGQTIVIGNALPYANPIEGGWSKKAPQGVVAPTKRAVELALRRSV